MAVADLIAGAQSRTTQFVSAADAALSAAVSAASAVSFTQITPGAIPITTPPTATPLIAPQLPPVTLDAPTKPGAAPAYQDIDTINPEDGKPAAFTKVTPTVTSPTAPTQLPGFQGRAPDLSLNVTWPTAPDTYLRSAPNLPDRAEPTAAEISIPRFDAVAPTDAPAPLTGLRQELSGAYHEAAPEFITMINGYVDAELTKINPQYHTQMAAIEAQLTRYLAGGTGLNPEVEDAIYARAQAKNDVEAKRVQDAALADAAARGFTLPTGALFSAMNRARQDAANNNSKAANEIAIAQAEMEQKNLQFAVSTSTGLRTTMVQATLAYMQNISALNGQAMEYAKSILASVVEVYNIAVKAFGMKLDLYKAEAVVYDTELKSAMADLERYKSEVAALQAMTQVDGAKVAVYKAEIDGVVARTSLYKTGVEAAVSKASLEKLKLDLFQAQVQAYGAEVQAKNSEWGGFKAQWDGEVSKLSAFKSEVDAYEAQQKGYAAGISAKAEAIKAQAMTNEARAKQFDAELQAYRTEYEVAGKKATVELENNRQEVVAFQATAQAAIANAQVQLEYYKANTAVGVAQAELDIKTMIASAEYTQKHMGLLAQLHNSNATIHANLAGSAMAGINTLASELKYE